ncbi:MAG: DUF1353 domain-containing protein [bacterium]
MSKFLTELYATNLDDKWWRIAQPLVYESDILQQVVEVPEGFVTDFTSVPRIPFIYSFWGGRCHREAALHDALYRIDFPGNISYSQANSVFLEAMKSRGKPFWIRWPMYLGVCIGGWSSFHKKIVMDEQWYKWAKAE